MGCIKCLSRIPFATLIATVLCCSGVGIFLGSLYRAFALTFRMFDTVFNINVQWLNDLHVVFIIIGAVMGLLSIILLLVGFLATGSTREKIYKGWKARLGGKISCAMFMTITYLLEIIWLLMTGCLVIVTFIVYIFWGVCNRLKDKPESEEKCIDLQQFAFFFPNDTDIKNRLKFCDEGNRKVFCKDTIEQTEIMFILSLIASLLVIISLIHYLMCLAANYARIKDQEKIRDLQELQYLQESEMGTLPKGRF